MVLRMRLTKKICRKKYLQVKIALEQPSPCCPPHPPHPPDPKLICEERSGYGNLFEATVGHSTLDFGVCGGSERQQHVRICSNKGGLDLGVFFSTYFFLQPYLLPKQTEQHKSFSIVLKIVLDFIVVYG